MTWKRITSAQNPSFKEALRLKDPKEAKAQNLFLLEGLRSVSELLGEIPPSLPPWKPISFWAEETFCQKAPSLTESLKASYPDAAFYLISERLFEKLSETKSPQGLLAVLQRPSYSLEQLLSPSPGRSAPLYVITERLQDPGNLGTIYRTADAMGASALFTLRGSVDLFSPKVIRSAMGSFFHLPAMQDLLLTDLLPLLKARGITLFASALSRKALPPWQADLTLPSAILIGNEGEGLSKEALSSADKTLFIPMSGSAESLNAGIAAGMLLYEASRQRAFCENR